MVSVKALWKHSKYSTVECWVPSVNKVLGGLIWDDDLTPRPNTVMGLWVPSPCWNCVFPRLCRQLELSHGSQPCHGKGTCVMQRWVWCGLLQDQGHWACEGGCHYLHYLHHSLVSGQTTGREHSPTHPLTENWIKNLLCMALPIRIRPSFPHSHSLPSGIFHKPLIFIHQRADRMKTTITRKKIKLITWTTALSNSEKLWAMPCRATQDEWVMVESSDKTWSTGKGTTSVFLPWEPHEQYEKAKR